MLDVEESRCANLARGYPTRGTTWTNKSHNFQMDYIEFPATDIDATKRFYGAVFGWSFTDYGPNYTSFHDGRLGGGFTMSAKPVKGGALVVLYAKELEVTRRKIIEAGGKIVDRDVRVSRWTALSFRRSQWK